MSDEIQDAPEPEEATVPQQATAPARRYLFRKVTVEDVFVTGAEDEIEAYRAAVRSYDRRPGIEIEEMNHETHVEPRPACGNQVPGLYAARY